MDLIDLTGKVFGNLTVISWHDRSSSGNRWLCRCDCGEERVVFGNNLRRGHTSNCRRCGSKTHGMCKSRTYTIWQDMTRRCRDTTSRKAHLYGLKGITVCERWRTFEGFLSDMGEAPNGMSIERKDSSGNYEPDNCRWASAKDQARNTTRNRFVEYKGEQVCIGELAERHGLEYSLLYKRLFWQGWNLEDALIPPVPRKRLV